MWHGTVGLIKFNFLNLINPICKVAFKTFLCIRTVILLNTRSNEWTEDLCATRDGFYWCGTQNKSKLFVLVIFQNKNYFQQFLWGPLRASTMLFGVIGFSGGQTAVCEITDLNLSNMDQIFSRSVLWYLLLLHRLILNLDFLCFVWWI